MPTQSEQVKGLCTSDNVVLTVASVTDAQYLKRSGGNIISDNAAPSGSIVMWGTTSAPSGWLLCNGAAVSRTTYSTLFAVIGTIFGTGDGSTTFNLPDLRDRFPIGAGTTYALNDKAGATSHLHTVNLGSHSHDLVGGTTIPAVIATGTFSDYTSTSDASGSTDSASSLPPYIGIQFIIKT